MVTTQALASPHSVFSSHRRPLSFIRYAIRDTRAPLSGTRHHLRSTFCLVPPLQANAVSRLHGYHRYERSPRITSLGFLERHALLYPARGTQYDLSECLYQVPGTWYHIEHTALFTTEGGQIRLARTLLSWSSLKVTKLHTIF